MRPLRVTIAATLMLAGLADSLIGQQVADSGFAVVVSSPAYAVGEGPVVAVDAAHRNFHTLRDRYTPFGAILRADGYRVQENVHPFSSAALRDFDVLVIANAGTARDAPWNLPTPSAFTDEEIAAVVEWVWGGGALFLIADHMPAAGAATELAAAFGIDLTNGYTYQPRPPDLPGDAFTRESGTLYDHPITRGRSPTERVDTVVTFTGQAFQARVPVDTLLRFGPRAVSYLPVDAEAGIDELTPRVASPNWLHAAVLSVGQGRVAVFGEAAMFSAQVAGSQRRPMGLNHPRARQNQQLLLNVMHWLSGRLDDLGQFFGDIEGTFILLDVQTGRTVRHNAERARTRFLPASTYKIPHTLIALEAGVASGPEFGLDWDSIAAPRQSWWPASWARDHTLATALPNSVVWYYQELARRIGPERMQSYVDRFDYGNRDISGGIDRFWLTGGLRISAEEQVEFLRRFYFGELAVSERATRIAKELLVLETGPGYRLSGKTGWAGLGESAPQIGWLVGYLERGDEVYFFALNIDIEKSGDAAARRSITAAILRHLGLMPN